MRALKALEQHPATSGAVDSFNNNAIIYTLKEWNGSQDHSIPKYYSYWNKLNFENHDLKFLNQSKLLKE